MGDNEQILVVIRPDSQIIQLKSPKNGGTAIFQEDLRLANEILGILGILYLFWTDFGGD